jgi:hypothetical protein
MRSNGTSTAVDMSARRHVFGVCVVKKKATQPDKGAVRGGRHVPLLLHIYIMLRFLMRRHSCGGFQQRRAQLQRGPLQRGARQHRDAGQRPVHARTERRRQRCCVVCAGDEL